MSRIGESYWLLLTFKVICCVEHYILVTRMAVSPMFGRIQEYELVNELFSAYLERIQLCFLANEVEGDKKVPVFLSVVGNRTYSLL